VVVSSVGLSIVIATFIGLALGLWLDEKFGTKPVLTIVFLVLGIIAGFRNYYIVMRRKMDDQ
jgi:ATP synthase protein I